MIRDRSGEQRCDKSIAADDSCPWEWSGVLWICACGETDDFRDPPTVDLHAEYEDYAAGCRGVDAS